MTEPFGIGNTAANQASRRTGHEAIDVLRRSLSDDLNPTGDQPVEGAGAAVLGSGAIKRERNQQSEMELTPRLGGAMINRQPVYHWRFVVRTRDSIAHAASRAAFVDAAQGLLRTKGWAAIRMEEVLQASGASKGALYHYFRSKQSLLEAVIDHMADQLVEQMEAAVDGSGDDPATRLNSVFGALGRWKVDRLDMLSAVLRTWHSEANAPARERLRAIMPARVAPLFARCLQPVPSEKSSVEMIELGRVVVAMVQALNDRLAGLLLDQRESRQRRDEALRAVTTVTSAIETVLHLEAGTVTLVTSDQFDRIFPDLTPDPRPMAENHDPKEDR